jgi:hypothetical protein
MFPVEFQPGNPPSSFFSSHPINKYFFQGVFSVIFSLAFLCWCLKCTPNLQYHAEVLSDVSKYTQAVMYLDRHHVSVTCSAEL